MEKDHLEILLEDMRDNFKLVLEGQTALILTRRINIENNI